jgi:Zn-dependent protease with chaperone function
MSAAPAPAQPLWAGLDGRLPRPAVPFAYALGLLFVSAAMVVLPLLYAAVVVLSGWAVVWWATHGFAWLMTGVQGSLATVKIRLFVYVVPLLAGGAVPVFLLKPFFSRRRAPPAGLTLDRRQQPELFAFVERLAAVVGAPAPDVIGIDCQVNAGAGLELGLLRREGSRLVLSIGLPLAAGMTLPQLAGVLAHEFGHFGQGIGMRLGQLIRRVNAWFQRVVYERDGWDASLQKGADEGGWTGIAYMGAQMMVALGRKLLFGLMVAGHGISCFLSRQMEFDADQYEARVAGGNVFADTMLRLRVLSAAAGHVFSAMLDREHLVDDLPSLVARVADNAPPRLAAEIRLAVQHSGSGLFDTHPSDMERLRRVRSGRFPGLLSGHQPAAALFRDFPGVCRRATARFYEDALGPHVPAADALLPVAAFVETPPAAPSADAQPQAPRLAFPPERPPLLAAHVAPAPGSAAAFTAARAQWRERAPAAVAALQRFSRGYAQWASVAQAEALMAAGLRVPAHQFSLPESTPQGIERAKERALAMQGEGAADVQAAERALAQRISLGVGWLMADAQAVAGGPELLSEARRLLDALATLEQAQASASPLRWKAIVLDCLLANQANRTGHEGLEEQIAKRLPDVRAAVDLVRTALEQVALPGPAWDIPPPWRDDAASHVRAANRALDVLADQHTRTVARLVQIADRVEAALRESEPAS